MREGWRACKGGAVAGGGFPLAFQNAAIKDMINRNLWAVCATGRHPVERPSPSHLHAFEIVDPHTRAEVENGLPDPEPFDPAAFDPDAVRFDDPKERFESMMTADE